MTKRQAIKKAQELAAAEGRDFIVAVGQRRSFVYPMGEAHGDLVIRTDGSVLAVATIGRGI